MKNPSTESTMLVTMTVADLRDVVRQEIVAAIGQAEKPKLLMPSAEAAELLSVPKTWIEARAREGKIPSVRAGHYRLFSVEDLKQFIAAAKETHE